MRILLLNGSPKKEKSRTLMMARWFLKGLSENETIQDIETDSYHLSDAYINDCTGCYRCWQRGKEPRCVYRDDMDTLIPLYEMADLVIWSFPVYFFLPPSCVVRFQQRMLPIMHPIIIEEEEGRFVHPYLIEKLGERIELFFVSGGLPTYENNFESLEIYTKLYFRSKAQRIFLPQSESTNKEYLRRKVERFQHILYEAGKSFSKEQGIRQKWLDKLQKPMLMDPREYLKISNRYLAAKE